MRIINLHHDTLFWFRVDSEVPGHIWHSMPWAAASYRRAQSREPDSTSTLKQVLTTINTHHIVSHLVQSTFPQQSAFRPEPALLDPGHCASAHQGARHFYGMVTSTFRCPCGLCAGGGPCCGRAWAAAAVLGRQPCIPRGGRPGAARQGLEPGAALQQRHRAAGGPHP